MQEESTGVVVCVVHKARVERHHQEVIGAIAGALLDLLKKPAIHERREHQQHHRDRHLSTDQQIPAPAAPLADHRLAALHDHREVGTGRLNRRRETEQNRAEHGDGEADRERPAIELERERDRQIGGELNLPKHADAAVAHRDAQDPARERDQQALGHQLRNQSASPGADRDAHGHFFRAGRGATREQAGHIGAGDKEDRERQRGEHRNQGRVGRRLRDSRLQFRADDEPSIAVRVRVRPLEIRGEDGQFRLRPRHAHLGLETSLDGDAAQVPVLEWARGGIARQSWPHHQRREEVGTDELIHPGESRRRDADDGEVDAAELHLPTQDGRVGAELLLPERVSENDDRVAARDLILLRPEVATQFGLDAHHREEVAADEQTERQLGQRIPGRGHS